MPEDYRSQWCKDFFDNKGCPRGVHCPFAHNLQQLRIDAAIKKGTVRPDFKLNFCADEHQKGTLCLLGSCLFLRNTDENDIGLSCLMLYCLGEVMVQQHIVVAQAPLGFPCVRHLDNTPFLLVMTPYIVDVVMGFSSSCLCCEHRVVAMRYSGSMCWKQCIPQATVRQHWSK